MRYVEQARSAQHGDALSESIRVLQASRSLKQRHARAKFDMQMMQRGAPERSGSLGDSHDRTQVSTGIPSASDCDMHHQPR
jgi:hypothetical protein